MKKLLFLAVVIFSIFIKSVEAQQLFAGSAAINITPKLPAALQGQFRLRIGSEIESPLIASAIAIESKNNGKAGDSVIFVSCDLTFITSDLSRSVRAAVAQKIPGFNVSKIIVSATHTHTVPVYSKTESSYPIPDSVLTPRQYFDILTERITTVIEEAWKKREPATVSWGLGHAVVANNRRAVYADGRSIMYGNTNEKIFRNIEGMEDHDVNALYFQNKKGKLVAVCVDVPCPSQEVEGHEAVNADYWHDVRVALKKRWGQDLTVITWVGASGDQSPHLLYRSAAENRMIKLAGRTRMEEIAYRVYNAVAETYNLVKKEHHSEVTFMHRMDSITLPARMVTEKEYAEAKKMADTIKVILTANPELKPKRLSEMHWYENVVDRYNEQQGKPAPTIETEIHAIRIGDITIATNEFELFTDYGVRMQARSNALQTFVVQCAVGYYIYLPTEIAVKGGGYSAIIQSCVVGPDAGTILTDRTIELINGMFPQRIK
ncbi:MAG: neutral/alkaline non-lysosomal ceramidase N-terminal domain-containing protein [Chitinophagaceae bacterium]|nr:neutral/alkaline non-lysosomal ceramidase N-terminal domain-containing protein [Chitinophagaceae bacterium]